jgi:hypothetical protein
MSKLLKRIAGLEPKAAEKTATDVTATETNRELSDAQLTAISGGGGGDGTGGGGGNGNDPRNWAG